MSSQLTKPRLSFASVAAEIANSATRTSSSSLSTKAIHGAVWTVFGFGFNQAIRLCGNLVVTRLLYPEAFGLMALFVVFITGVELFSDVGLRGSVIHHPRGDCPKFLDTVWTVQIIRGILLWLVCLALAYPAASFFQKPTLAMLIPVAALSAVIRGFASTSLLTVNRHLAIRGLTLIQVAAQIAATLVMIAAAYWTRSVWALVLGTVTMALTRTIMSHLIPGHKNVRLHWDKEVVSSLMTFGSWIMVSSGFTFLLGQGDRLLLGRYFDEAELGVYWIGATLATLPTVVFERLGMSVLQPSYARLHSTHRKIHKQLPRIRAGVMALLMPPFAILIVFSDGLIDWLYDERYAAASQFAAGLATAGLIRVSLDQGPIFEAIGDSRSQFLLMLSRGAITFLAMVIGLMTAGSFGLIVGLTIAPLMSYPVQAHLYARRGVWVPKVDLASLFAASMVVLLGLALRHEMGGGWSK